MYIITRPPCQTAMHDSSAAFYTDSCVLMSTWFERKRFPARCGSGGMFTHLSAPFELSHEIILESSSWIFDLLVRRTISPCLLCTCDQVYRSMHPTDHTRTLLKYESRPARSSLIRRSDHSLKVMPRQSRVSTANRVLAIEAASSVTGRRAHCRLLSAHAQKQRLVVYSRIGHIE